MPVALSDFRIEKTAAVCAVDWSPHHHAYVNPYNGCTAGCPFCFWLSQEGWEGRIQVRSNIAEKLESFLETRSKDEFLYLGSVCDPFMELEKKERLSYRCLQKIRRHGVPLLITSSALSDVIREYIPLLQSMQQRVIVVVELARPAPIAEFNRTGYHPGIANANYLQDHGLEVWATLSPVLPHITDIDRVLAALNPAIPLYTDSLRCEPGSIQARKVLEWIRSDYPEYLQTYIRIVEEQDISYFSEIQEKAERQHRIRFFPYDLSPK